VKYLPAIAAAVTSTQVGSAMVATRFVVDQTGPISLALLRYLIGFACLLPLALLATPRVRFERCDLLPLALLGVIQFGVLIALLNYGLRFIPSARAALIFATVPLLTMVIAAALGHERLGAAKTLGVLLTIAGWGWHSGRRRSAGAAGRTSGSASWRSSPAPCAAPRAASSTDPICGSIRRFG